MDVRDERKKLILELKQRGLRERITGRHGAETAPNAHEKGSYPIYGIFALEEIEMVQGGFRGGNPTLSNNHRFAWAEFTYDSILGTDRGEAYTPAAKPENYNWSINK